MSEKNTSENTSEELEQDGELKAQGDDDRSPADFIQFSVTFDDEDDDTESPEGADTTEDTAASDIYSSLAAAESTADTADAGDATKASADVAYADASNSADTAKSPTDNHSGEAVANTDSDADGSEDHAESHETSEAEADALASANASAEVTARNAARVNETLGLAKSEKRSTLADHEDASHNAEPTMTLASRIDRVLVGGGADDVLLKTYPTFALNKVTLAGAKGRVNVLDNVEFACYAGHSYALLISDDTDAGITADLKRRALMGVMTGLVQPTSGAVMNKSANIAELEPIELRGHRLGIVPQLHAVQPYLDAEHNVLYAMDASNRNFLKPRPVIARELLAKVGFSEATTGMAVGKMPLVQQRLVAIARAISTEAEVLILDEPTRGLNDDDTVAVFAALAKLAHSGDPKHCVIVLTASREIAEAADTLFEV